jgi:hypothetical protein
VVCSLYDLAVSLCPKLASTSLTSSRMTMARMYAMSFMRSSFQRLVPQLKAGRRFQQRKQCSATSSSVLCERKSVSGASATVLIALSNSQDTGALLSLLRRG